MRGLRGLGIQGLANPVFSAGCPGGAVTPWYLSGGILPADCIAAYKAIGAASLAASYDNLAAPGNGLADGTYDITASVPPPAFNVADGWTFDGLTQWLFTHVPLTSAGVPDNRNYTMIVRYSGASGNGMAMGFYSSAGIGFYVSPARGAPERKYSNGSVSIEGAATGAPAGVLAVAGANAYWNGAADGTVTTVRTVHDIEISIGGVYSNTAPATPAYLCSLKVQAVAIYKVVITGTQVSAVTTAMTGAGF